MAREAVAPLEQKGRMSEMRTKKSIRPALLFLAVFLLLAAPPAAFAVGPDDWNPFTDVSETDGFYDDVRYVYTNGLMDGVSDISFAPGQTLSRGMLVTILGRVEKIDPADYGVPSFDDTPAGAYDTPYITWAVQKGLVTGYSAKLFGPDDPVNREQLATILGRYAEIFQSVEMSESANMAGYADIQEISSWSHVYLSWGRATGVIQGRSISHLGPKDEVTRAEVAASIRHITET